MVSATVRRTLAGCPLCGRPASRICASDLGHDAGHHLDGFDRILAGRAFGGEHDGVAAVVDGIGHVAGFGARGARILDHGFQHLRRRDDGLAML